jgi:hypothetical protein
MQEGAMSDTQSNLTATNAKKMVTVHVNRRKVELPSAEVSGAEILAAAQFEGQAWDLFRLQGEGDPTGGELILADQRITVHKGEHFRVIPGNRTFGG